MKDARLGTMLRRVLMMSMSAPIAVGAASCGGAIESIATDEDSGSGGYEHPDARAPRDGGSYTDAMLSFDSPGRDHFVGDAGPGTCGEDAAALPDAGGFCFKYVPAPCGIDASAPITQEECKAYCGADSGTFSCSFQNVEGHAAIACTSCAVGRRPEGYELAPGTTTSSLGDYFAVVAELEAASVDAFLILRDELVQHGAPKDLVAGAERAARDEVRHARMTARVAKRNGATAKGLSTIARRAQRSLEEIAVENAIEGCVRETYGAVTAMWQAERAEDPSVRALMKRIAVDETRHAALAWSVSQWMRGQLSEEAGARVDQAMRSAVHTLSQEVSSCGPELTRSAGLPTAIEAQKLLGAMRDVVWS
jgi:hypothetical protein